MVRSAWSQAASRWPLAGKREVTSCPPDPSSQKHLASPGPRPSRPGAPEESAKRASRIRQRFEGQIDIEIGMDFKPGLRTLRRSGKLLILRLTPRGLRRFRLETTRSCSRSLYR